MKVTKRTSIAARPRKSTVATNANVASHSSTTSANNIPVSDKNVCLERIIGSTCKSNSSFTINPVTTELAFPAGSTIIVQKGNKQTHFLKTGGYKTIQSLQYSYDGRFLAAGEKGKAPGIFIWQITENEPKSKYTLICKIIYHKFGTSSICFDDSGELLMSCGDHDGLVCLWNLSSAINKDKPTEITTPIASAKLKNEIVASAFLKENRAFVTAGNKHIKSWSVDKVTNQSEDERRLSRLSDANELIKDRKVSAAAGSSGSSDSSSSLSWEGRAASLGSFRSVSFIEVACYDDRCYAISNDGQLFCFLMVGGSNRGRLTLEKTMNLKVSLNSLFVNQKWICITYSNGGIKFIDRATLDNGFMIPKPKALGKEIELSSEAGVTPKPQATAPELLYPDALTCAISKDDILYTIYSDGSFIGWNFSLHPKIRKQFCDYSHNQCIWDMQILTNQNESDILQKSGLAKNCLVTCSADNTIRFWDCEQLCSGWSPDRKSSSLQNIIHIDEQYQALRKLAEPPSATSGIRCFTISQDLNFIASGDRTGNLRVHHIPTSSLVTFKEAHDSEILSVHFSPKEDNLLASAGRDRLIHIFDCQASNEEGKSFPLLDTLDDHTSSITSIKFVHNNEKENKLELISCSADKSIIFRSIQSNRSHFHVKKYANTLSTGTLFDMCVDQRSNSVITSGKDKKLARYSIESGKLVNDSINLVKESEDVIKLSLHPSGEYSLAISTDKCVRLYSCHAPGAASTPSADKENSISLAASKPQPARSNPSKCLLVAKGASFITSACFSPCFSRIIASSADGLIIVWKIHPTIQQKLQQAQAVSGKLQKAFSTEEKTVSTPMEAAQQELASVIHSIDAAASDLDEVGITSTERKTWSSVEDVETSLVSTCGLAAPKSLDAHGFGNIFSRNDEASAALRRLTIEPSTGSDPAAVTTDTKVLAGVLLDSEFGDENFFDFENFSEISAPSRLSLSRAFRQKSPAHSSSAIQKTNNDIFLPPLLRSTGPADALQTESRPIQLKATEGELSSPCKNHPQTPSSAPVTPQQSEQPEEFLTPMEIEDPPHAQSIDYSVFDAESSSKQENKSDEILDTLDNLLDDHAKNIKATKLLISNSTIPPSPAPIVLTRRHTISNDKSLLSSTPDQQPTDEDDPASYQLLQRHQLAMNLLRDAFENAITLYDDLNIDYEQARKQSTSQETPSEFYVYEKVLDDYDNLFSSITEKLSGVPIPCHTPPGSPKLGKFSDMLVQLASMLNNKRIVP